MTYIPHETPDQKYHRMLKIQEKRRKQVKEFIEFMDNHPGKHKQEEVAKALGINNYEVWVVVMIRLPFEPYSVEKIKDYQERVIWKYKKYILDEEIIV